YDLTCRAFASEGNIHERTLGALIALGVVALCATATQLFAGRAAFLIAGAVLATLMAANVFFVIIPGQKRLVAALRAGTPIDPRDGARGKQRSVHNTYFTLPVVFAMLATHEPAAFAHPRAWAVLAGFMLAGALIRHFFVRWHDGGRIWGLLVAAGVLLVALLAWIAPPSIEASARATSSVTATAPPAPLALTPAQWAALDVPAPDTAAVLPLLALRCGGCHSAAPTIMGAPPKGVIYDTATDAEKHAAHILRQAVQLKVMPPGNMTSVTDEEREALGRWAAAHQAGAQ
ncbi:MAG: urate hydroxylase PuuD, partial [Arenimonas sp.]